MASAPDTHTARGVRVASSSRSAETASSPDNSDERAAVMGALPTPTGTNAAPPPPRGGGLGECVPHQALGIVVRGLHRSAAVAEISGQRPPVELRQVAFGHGLPDGQVLVVGLLLRREHLHPVLVIPPLRGHEVPEASRGEGVDVSVGQVEMRRLRGQPPHEGPQQAAPVAPGGRQALGQGLPAEAERQGADVARRGAAVVEFDGLGADVHDVAGLSVLLGGVDLRPPPRLRVEFDGAVDGTPHDALREDVRDAELVLPLEVRARGAARGQRYAAMQLLAYVSTSSPAAWR